MFVVMNLSRDVSVEILGIPEDLKLSWFDGMIGALPVFKTEEQAYNYIQSQTQNKDTRVLRIKEEIVKS